MLIMHVDNDANLAPKDERLKLTKEVQEHKEHGKVCVRVCVRACVSTMYHVGGCVGRGGGAICDLVNARTSRAGSIQGHPRASHPRG